MALKRSGRNGRSTIVSPDNNDPKTARFSGPSFVVLVCEHREQVATGHVVLRDQFRWHDDVKALGAAGAGDSMRASDGRDSSSRNCFGGFSLLCDLARHVSDVRYLEGGFRYGSSQASDSATLRGILSAGT